MLKTIGGAFVGTFVLAIVCAVALGQEESGNTYAPQAAQMAAPAAPPAAITYQPTAAADLIAAYKGNEMRGDAAYKDKPVQVTGVVVRVGEDIMGTPYVVLGTGKRFEIPQVQMMFSDSMRGELATLNVGDTITTDGCVTGLMMNVLVKNCD
jgi:hypothetical protein